MLWSALSKIKVLSVIRPQWGEKIASSWNLTASLVPSWNVLLPSTRFSYCCMLGLGAFCLEFLSKGNEDWDGFFLIWYFTGIHLFYIKLKVYKPSLIFYMTDTRRSRFRNGRDGSLWLGGASSENSSQWTYHMKCFIN